ncbi:MAG: CBS domain-containing protein [Planctomycetota bacterium]|nr:MAG: CBS domain-containing protein [Planctomycetota bacterium]
MKEPILARDLMSRPVRRLTASTPVRDAAAFLLRHGISGAPVVDARGDWLGVFTKTDLARHVEEALAAQRRERTLESREPILDAAGMPSEEFGRTPVSDLMTLGLFTVFPESTLDEILRALVAFEIHRVFVIDERTGELEGVITSMDVLRHLAAHGVPAGR